MKLLKVFEDNRGRRVELWDANGEYIIKIIENGQPVIVEKFANERSARKRYWYYTKLLSPLDRV